MIFYNKTMLGVIDLLSELLSKQECARCRICCSFDSFDLWETPIISKDLACSILKNCCPEQEFIENDGNFLLKLEREPDEDLYYCTMLDREKGCKLQDEKPFDCKIWPFRVMDFNKTRVITVSPVCPAVIKKPLSEIISVVERLSTEIFCQADKCPSMVKPYIQGYPILITEQIQENK